MSSAPANWESPAWRIIYGIVSEEVKGQEHAVTLANKILHELNNGNFLKVRALAK